MYFINFSLCKTLTPGKNQGWCKSTSDRCVQLHFSSSKVWHVIDVTLSAPQGSQQSKVTPAPTAHSRLLLNVALPVAGTEEQNRCLSHTSLHVGHLGYLATLQPCPRSFPSASLRTRAEEGEQQVKAVGSPVQRFCLPSHRCHSLFPQATFIRWIILVSMVQSSKNCVLYPET